MAERVEITDYENARAWLALQEPQTRIWFATRCALRALPGLGTWAEATARGFAFTACRRMLIPAAAASCPAAEVNRLNDAASAAIATSDSDSLAASAASAPKAYMAAYGATSAYSAARNAASAHTTAYSADDSAVAARAAASTRSTSAAATSAWTAATMDTNAPMNWGTLWPDDTPQPDGLQEAWEALKEQWEADGPHWAFWIEWYEAVRDGRWEDGSLIYRIATKVEEEDWDAGPERVAKRIEEIEAAQEVANSAGDVLESLETTLSAADLPPRGHNNPPEMIDEPSLAEDVADLRRAVAVLEQHAKSDNPDKEELQEAVEDIERWYHHALKWLGRKLDLAVDTMIKWAIPAGGGYLLLNPVQLHKLIEASKTWLQFLH